MIYIKCMTNEKEKSMKALITRMVETHLGSQLTDYLVGRRSMAGKIEKFITR